MGNVPGRTRFVSNVSGKGENLLGRGNLIESFGGLTESLS